MKNLLAFTILGTLIPDRRVGQRGIAPRNEQTDALFRATIAGTLKWLSVIAGP
jgi:hypothetical protein